MAYYLVRAKPKVDRLAELAGLLRQGAFLSLEPFGRALSASLAGARIDPQGTALWEEEDYCSPPLAQERKQVLDNFFDNIRVEPVVKGAGWRKIRELPLVFNSHDGQPGKKKK